MSRTAVEKHPGHSDQSVHGGGGNGANADLPGAALGAEVLADLKATMRDGGMSGEEIRAAIDEMRATYRETGEIKLPENIRTGVTDAELQGTLRNIRTEARSRRRERANKSMYGEGLTDARVANYRPAATLAESCATCCAFFAEGLGSGSCALVAGPVRVDYTCDLFATEAEDDDEMRPEIVMMSEDGAGAIAKADDAKQMLFGWASVAISKDGATIVDSQGDIIEPDVLEDAAYEFVLKFREGDEMHTENVVASLVESFVVTDDKLAALAKGDAAALEVLKRALPIGWWVGFHIPDRDLYLKARDQYPMFSIGGVAVREEVEE